MKIIAVLFLIIVVGANFGGCGMMSKRYTKSKTETFSINAAGKKKFKLENVRGTIKISRSADSGLIGIKASKELQVKKKNLDKPFDEMTVKLDTIGSIVSVMTDFEKSRDIRFFKFDDGTDARVDYEISLPRGIEIEIKNNHGNISGIDLGNDLNLDLVNGDVSLEGFSGLLECETVNGDLSANIDSTRGINLNTVNGDVSLTFSNFINANLRAETVNGKITEDNLQLTDVTREKKLLKAKIGKDTPDADIKIETVNGKIRLSGKNVI